MSSTALTHLTKIEASLWEAADQLRANSKLTSSEYCNDRTSGVETLQASQLRPRSASAVTHGRRRAAAGSCTLRWRGWPTARPPFIDVYCGKDESSSSR